MQNAIDIVELDSLLRYANKYNIPLDYAQTIYNMLYLDNPTLDDEMFVFRMPASQKEVLSGERTGELIQIGVQNYRSLGMGNVTWIGIEGVNLDHQLKSKQKAGESKLDICRRIYDSSISRKANIDNFRYHAGCTSASAATYYQKIKGEK